MSWFTCNVLGHGVQWNEKDKNECPVCEGYYD